jgi:hypothetical protein
VHLDTPIILGRTVAACVHPFAAWQVFSKAWRLAVVTVFAGLSYAIVLSTLLVLNP